MTTINHIAARPSDLSPQAAADKKLLRAAQQFESLFLEKLLGKMRASTSMGNEKQGMGKAGSGMYDLLMDRSVAQKLSAEGGGTGIANFLYRQWTGNSSQHTVVPAAPTIQRSAAPASPTVPDLNFEHLTPGVRDNGEIPLRDMLPPTGLEEKNDFSLNAPIGDPDAPVRETSQVRGQDYELQNIATTDNDPETGLSRQRNGIPQGNSGNDSLRSHATEAYRRSTSDHLSGGHERDLGTGGGRA